MSKVAGKVEALSKELGVSDHKIPMDYVADKFSELSGNDISDDRIIRLCVNLCRAGAISKIECLSDIHAYLNEVKEDSLSQGIQIQ